MFASEANTKSYVNFDYLSDTKSSNTLQCSTPHSILAKVSHQEIVTWSIGDESFSAINFIVSIHSERSPSRSVEDRGHFDAPTLGTCIACIVVSSVDTTERVMFKYFLCSNSVVLQRALCVC